MNRIVVSIKGSLTDKRMRKKVIVGCIIAVFAVFVLIRAFGGGGGGGEIVAGDVKTEISPVKAAADGDGTDAEKTAVKDEGKREVGVIMVDVGGAVNMPAVVAIPEGSRVIDAIKLAGGLRADANVQFVNQAEVLSDGQKLYIPTNDEVTSGQFGSAGSGGEATGSGGSTPTGRVQGNGKVNINTADLLGLQQLSGVGPSTAQKILDYRNSAGKFTVIEDLMNVSGIGQKTFDKMKDNITV